MDNQEQIISVYIKTDTYNYIIAVNSDVHLSDTADWIKIDDNTTGTKSRDCYSHAQGNYFDNPLLDDNGCHNYKLIDNIAVECTAEDKQSELSARPKSPPTEIELIYQNITDLELNDISQGQQITDFELMILGDEINV